MLPTQEISKFTREESSHSAGLMGVGTAVPSLQLTQQESLDFILKNFEIKESTRQLYQRMLSNPSIATRHFALDTLSDVLDLDHERINARFEKGAIRLSTEALQKAMASAQILPKDLDYLAVATCTGYLCPGLAPQLIETCQLKQDIHYADLVGMGCGAALPALEQAFNFTKANPGSVAAVVATEICSAAMFSSDDIDIVVSNSIFADGSAAVILKSFHCSSPRKGGGQEGGGEAPPISNFQFRDSKLEIKGPAGTPPRPPSPPQDGSVLWRTLTGRGINLKSFGSLVIPEWRDTLRFRTEQGHLKNVLGKNVPIQAAQAIKKLTHRLLTDSGIQATKVVPTKVAHWMIHPGGEKVLNEIEKSLGLIRTQTQASWNILRNFGNMSSATVLFVMEEEMKINPPEAGEWGFLCSFGAGFSVHAALIQF